mmetsp:Transcript_33180/g.30119  ORF Transcript_33180/g.30119 Transcript_33180/m.30119 type:complete len:137 (-) Transcript_33180:49-459(-)
MVADSYPEYREHKVILAIIAIIALAGIIVEEYIPGGYLETILMVAISVNCIYGLYSAIKNDEKRLLFHVKVSMYIGVASLTLFLGYMMRTFAGMETSVFRYAENIAILSLCTIMIWRGWSIRAYLSKDEKQPFFKA